MTQTEPKRHVKLVCTLGPASSSSEILEGMLKAGMNVARLNLAYGTLEEHTRLISEVRSLSERLSLNTGVLVDLPGLKRRSGDVRAVFGDHLEFAIANRADLVALSFLTSARQVEEVKGLLQGMKAPVPVIAKIEQAQALRESRALLEISEGVMVARGDLALQTSIEKVPLAQKHLIREANRLGKPVITATQMLESMVRSPGPTRAEATDVANAVLDGSDALMLSEETAIGGYAVEATEMMARISLEAETALPYEQMLREGWEDTLPEVDDATARAACQIAHQVQARAIIAFTTGGSTALRVSKYRPRPPILAVTPFRAVMGRLSLSWGVMPVMRPAPSNLEEALVLAGKIALETRVGGVGDLVVVTAGIPLAVPGSTNLVKVHTI